MSLLGINIKQTNTTMRKKINRTAICSSDNYELSKRVHRAYLREIHESFDIEITVKIPYVKCFGTLIKITMEEAKRLEPTLIIWR